MLAANMLLSLMTVESSLSNQDHSMSVLSVHMGLDGVCQQRKPCQSLDSTERQEGSVATGGRCIALVSMAAIRFTLHIRDVAFVINCREEFFFLSKCCC